MRSRISIAHYLEFIFLLCLSANFLQNELFNLIRLRSIIAIAKLWSINACAQYPEIILGMLLNELVLLHIRFVIVYA